ncbi:MAG: methyltransferase domain-containing protein [Acidimicrobiia bacterium]
MSTVAASGRQRFNPIDRALRRLRARSVARHVTAGSRVVDVGCGLDNWLIRSMTGPGAGARWRHDSLGIDPDLDEHALDEHGRRTDIVELARREPGGFDAATSLAVIEHLPPETVVDHLASIRSVLRPGGVLVLTTPTPRSKPVLEFLAYRLRVISAHEIRDHRQYFHRTALVGALTAAGFERIVHTPFQLGLNQRVIAHRPESARSA